jgi:hypothetical protein
MRPALGQKNPAVADGSARVIPTAQGACQKRDLVRGQDGAIEIFLQRLDDSDRVKAAATAALRNSRSGRTDATRIGRTAP